MALNQFHQAGRVIEMVTEQTFNRAVKTAIRVRANRNASGVLSSSARHGGLEQKSSQLQFSNVTPKNRRESTQKSNKLSMIIINDISDKDDSES